MIAPTMDIASQIKAARAREGLSQSEAAAKWHVNLRSLQDWEINRSCPRGATLNRLLPILFPPETSGPSSPSSRSSKQR